MRGGGVHPRSKPTPSGSVRGRPEAGSFLVVTILDSLLHSWTICSVLGILEAICGDSFVVSFLRTLPFGVGSGATAFWPRALLTPGAFGLDTQPLRRGTTATVTDELWIGLDWIGIGPPFGW